MACFYYELTKSNVKFVHDQLKIEHITEPLWIKLSQKKWLLELGSENKGENDDNKIEYSKQRNYCASLVRKSKSYITVELIKKKSQIVKL